MNCEPKEVLIASEKYIDLKNWRITNYDSEHEIDKRKEKFRELIQENMDNLLEICEIGYSRDLYEKLFLCFQSLKDKALGFK